MYYNLKLFGKKIREIRGKHGYSREKLSEISHINLATIRRLETNPASIPKQETLEELSKYLKKDLNHLLLQYRVDDYTLLNNIQLSIENKLNCGNKDLSNEILQLKDLLNPSINSLVQIEIKQLILLSEGIIAQDNDKHNLALEKFKDSIKLNTEDFNLHNYKQHNFSNLEFRILMNIAISLNKIGYQEAYLEILKFCMDSIDINNPLYYKLCHNISGAYIRKKNYIQALLYVNKGICYCDSNNIYDGLHILYYTKGLAEYHLNDEEYINSIDRSIELCSIFKNDGFKEVIFNSDMVQKSNYNFKE